MTEATEKKTSNFIRTIIDKDLESGKHQSVQTRFPPEPNGYLHIGHAKAICVNFGLAQDYKGSCNLRFDDTNPLKEDVEFEEVIKEDITWLGFQWANLYTASGYFDQLHDYAVELIRKGKAYVDSLTADQIREYRGTLKEPGKDSPHRNRSVEENLDLFKRMREGEFDEGAHILRAKIDMASPNMNMRDPTLYRIRKVDHHHTGNKWCIYPMYDYTHCISDALENITHSLCSLEFEDHRPLYDWVLNQLTDLSHPQQIEFARLNVSYTIVGKRYLRDLVEGGEVDGWEDPRMPTLRGYRRRGYTPVSIRNFCERAGLSKSNSVVDVAMLEHAIREDLDRSAPRAMAVLKPLKVTITSYEDGKIENIQAPVHPQDPERGHRTLPFSKELYIDQDDFMEDPPKKYFRLAPGQEVRLRNSYVIKCEEVIKNAAGEVVELRCSHDPATLGANPVGRKVKGIIHWLSAQHAVPATIRLYDRLFNHEDPLSDKDNFKSFLNPDSLEIVKGAFVEPGLANVEPESRFQFERTGYFVADRYDCKPGDLVFNRVVSLRDSWK